MSDKTRPVNESIILIFHVIGRMQTHLGYREVEAWERVSDELLYCLEEHDFDPLTLEEQMWVSSTLMEVLGGQDEH